jgi:hypothetical protein
VKVREVLWNIHQPFVAYLVSFIVLNQCRLFNNR